MYSTVGRAVDAGRVPIAPRQPGRPTSRSTWGPAETRALEACLAEAIPDLELPLASERGFLREPFEGSSWYAQDVVTVLVPGRADRRILLKDFGTHVGDKGGMAIRRERELRIYRDLLDHSLLETPHYVGSVWEPEHERFWLLIEFIDGADLRSYGFEHYVHACAWLGKMHGYFHRRLDELKGATFLARFDGRLFRSEVEIATRNAGLFSRGLARRLTTALDGHEDLAEAMTEQASTLVHGGFLPQGVMVQARSSGVRIATVDWELAGVGPGLFDLALMTDGFDPPRLARLWDAYEHEASAWGFPVPHREDLTYLIDCFRLQRRVAFLSRSRKRGYSEEAVAKLVGEVEELRASVLPARSGVAYGSGGGNVR